MCPSDTVAAMSPGDTVAAMCPGDTEGLSGIDEEHRSPGNLQRQLFRPIPQHAPQAPGPSPPPSSGTEGTVLDLPVGVVGVVKMSQCLLGRWTYRGKKETWAFVNLHRRLFSLLLGPVHGRLEAWAMGGNQGPLGAGAVKGRTPGMGPRGRVCFLLEDDVVPGLLCCSTGRAH